jgi:leucine dehydrogenase
MNVVATKTKHVLCTSGEGGDASAFTAIGVRRSIQAAVQFKLGRDNLDGMHIAIQGAGHVGYYLAKELQTLGAQITMCDINQEHLDRCIDELNVAVAPVDQIHALDCDIFSPCALGATLNQETIPQIKASMVVGSANNQLAHQSQEHLLHERGILYTPDFVANAGGLIYAASMYSKAGIDTASEKTDKIYDTIMQIFERSKQENLMPNEVATKIAQEKLEQ